MNCERCSGSTRYDAEALRCYGYGWLCSLCIKWLDACGKLKGFYGE